MEKSCAQPVEGTDGVWVESPGLPVWMRWPVEESGDTDGNRFLGGEMMQGSRGAGEQGRQYTKAQAAVFGGLLLGIAAALGWLAALGIWLAIQ